MTKFLAILTVFLSLLIVDSALDWGGGSTFGPRTASANHCVAAESTDSITSLWRANGNALDTAVGGLSADNGSFVGNANATGAGVQGNAFSFDGTGDRVSAGLGADITLTGTAVTIAGWIYPTVAKDAVYFGRSASGINDYALFRLTFVQAIIRTPTETQFHAGVDLPLNTWSHVALVYDGGTAVIYIDGVLKVTVSDTGNLASGTAPFFIGGRNFDELSFAGRIDDVYLWNSARAESVIDGLIACSQAEVDHDADGICNDGASDKWCIGTAASDLCPATAVLPSDTQGCSANDVDPDADGICSPGAPTNGPGDCQISPADNCPNDANSGQVNLDLDALGDACDPDDDGDGVIDGVDNCPTTANGGQENLDEDGQGDACDLDDDNDGENDGVDNCPTIANGDQFDLDSDNQGDVCDEDDDGDGTGDVADNCPTVANVGQSNIDADAFGDACDLDDDGDGDNDVTDNCPTVANGDQFNLDADAFGDACDLDDDGDGTNDVIDNCPTFANPDQLDLNNNNVGDACEDADQDGVLSPDLCGTTPEGHVVNAFGCSAVVSSADSDGDGVCNRGATNPNCAGSDNCPNTPVSERLTTDSNGCGKSQVDTDLDGVCTRGQSSSLCTGSDTCPNTSVGERPNVDSNGCGRSQVDSDSDGVCNRGAASNVHCTGADLCPNTPPPGPFLPNGCRAPQDN